MEQWGGIHILRQPVAERLALVDVKGWTERRTDWNSIYGWYLFIEWICMLTCIDGTICGVIPIMPFVITPGWPATPIPPRHNNNPQIHTLPHAFSSSWVDYCNAVFNGAPQYVMGTLQCILNAAARLVSNTRKYDRGLSTLIHDQLHWLNGQERVEYKLAVVVRRCLENKAPRYLVNCCTPVADVVSQHRRSVNVNHLIIPR